MYANIASVILKTNKVPKEKQKKIIQDAKKKLESETYEKIKTGRGGKKENSNPRKENKFKAAIEEAIEDEGIKTTKENFNKIFPKKEETDSPDINEIVSKMIITLSGVNIELSHILKAWNYISEPNQKKLIHTLSKMQKILKKHKGEILWKKLLQ